MVERRHLRLISVNPEDMRDQSLSQRLHELFDAVLNEPVPERFLSLIRAAREEKDCSGEEEPDRVTEQETAAATPGEPIDRGMDRQVRKSRSNR